MKKTNLVATEFDPTVSSDRFQKQLRNNGGFFPVWKGSTAPTIPEAISDLEYDDWKEDETYHRLPPKSDFQKAMRRKLGRVFKKQKITDHIVSNHSKRVRDRFQYMIDHSITNIRNLPDNMKTKKFSQKLLPINWLNHMLFIQTTIFIIQSRVVQTQILHSLFNAEKLWSVEWEWDPTKVPGNRRSQNDTQITLFSGPKTSIMFRK